jgi:hypothetical protein
MLRLTRYQKRFALVVVDLILLNVAVWLAMSASWGHFYMASTRDVFLLPAAVPPLLAGSSFSIWAPWFLASTAFAGVYAVSQTAAIFARAGA